MSVQQYQAAPVVNKPNRQWPNQQIKQTPIWCSVDLRDGNQALLEPMTITQKLRLFNLLVSMGFKEIEIGFPAASQTDFDFCRKIIDEQLIPDDVTVQVLVQAREHLIQRTFQALQGVKKAILHVYNSTSTIQRQTVFKKSVAEIKAIAVQGASWIKQYAAHYPQTQWRFQYSPESFSQTELPVALEICNAVIKTIAPSTQQPLIINLPTTVEVNTANVFADQVEWMIEHLNQRDCLIVSVHTNNDRGCAVASAEMALLAGADRVEGTLMGNGERTGNMDIFTLAMNLYSQGIDPKLDISLADEVVDTLTSITNIAMHPRHPWLGELVFTAFSGSHQDAINKCLQARNDEQPWQVAYLPINPEDLGRKYEQIIRINSQSGKGGMSYVLQQHYGLYLPKDMQIQLSASIQALSEQSQSEVSAQQIYQQFLRQFCQFPSIVQLENFSYHNQQHQLLATLLYQSEQLQLSASAQGPIAAFVDLLQQHFSVEINIRLYHEHALSCDSQAQAISYIGCEINQQMIYAAAIEQDSIRASFNAILQALNSYLSNVSEAF